MLGEESPGRQAQRDDVAERANIEQRAAAQPVNQPESDEGENQVGHADSDGLQERGLGAEAGKLKDARREIEDGVDAGQLVEEGDQDGEQDGFAQTPCPETRRRRLFPRTRRESHPPRLQFAALEASGSMRCRTLRPASRSPLRRPEASAGLSGRPKQKRA